MGLIAISPGVQAVGAQDQLAVRGMTPAVGSGGRNAYGGFGATFDGVVNQEVALARAAPEIPHSVRLASQDALLGRARGVWRAGPVDRGQQERREPISW